MASEIKEKMNALLKGDKKIRIFAAIGVISVLLILLSELIPSSTPHKNNASDEYNPTEYCAELEKRAEGIIGSIDGVGRCKVMITVKSSPKSFFAQNSKVDDNSGSSSRDYEYAFYESENGDTPILLHSQSPEIQGVVVVCEGGENPKVKENVLKCISSLFDVSSSNISISKIQG